MRAYSFDGHGINDAIDQYKPRLATLTQEGKAHGALLAAAPELLTSLERMIKTISADQIQPDVYANAIRAIKQANGEA
jgi:hypothetical protein